MNLPLDPSALSGSGHQERTLTCFPLYSGRSSNQKTLASAPTSNRHSVGSPARTERCGLRSRETFASSFLVLGHVLIGGTVTVAAEGATLCAAHGDADAVDTAAEAAADVADDLTAAEPSIGSSCGGVVPFAFANKPRNGCKMPSANPVCEASDSNACTTSAVRKSQAGACTSSCRACSSAVAVACKAIAKLSDSWAFST